MTKIKLFRDLSPMLAILLSTACATLPAPSDPAKDTKAAAPVQTGADEAAETAAAPARPAPPRPNIALSEDLLFRLLLAELAGQRGQADIAVRHYLALARETRDPAVIERAARIAVHARDDAAAERAARLWAEVEPENPDARQVLTVMSLRRGKLDRALAHLEVILAHSRGEFAQKLWLITSFLAREADRAAVMRLMERLLADHMADPEALYAFAHLAARLGDVARAEALLLDVLAERPANEPAAMTYLSLLLRKGETGRALRFLEQTLGHEAAGFDLRLAYARLLTDVERFDDARREFETLAVAEPEHVDVLYALGLIHLQAARLDEAAPYFERLARLKKRVSDSNYYLARIAEEKDELDQASDLYQGVHEGERYFDARIRLSLILAKQGQVEKALGQIRALAGASDAEGLLLIQAEAEILADQRRYAEAMAVYDRALAAAIDHDLLYARAMLAEKMGRLDILEADLKRILSKDRDNATVLNALGYTLADRTDRYAEAYDYIRRAHELSPDDFYILDSMGWVLYRLGRLDEAVGYLRRALALQNDPEVAAHLGEVLWVMGDKKTAREVWETALRATPADDKLLKVIERFKP